MRPKEYRCIKCGTFYYHEIRYNGAQRYCHKCYLQKRRVYEQKRIDKFNAVLKYRGDINWPHVNNKSKIFESGLFGINGNIQRQSTDSKHKKS